MPVERRSSTRQTVVLVVSLVAVLAAVGLAVAALRSAGNSKDVTIGGGQTQFDAGLAEERAAAIAADGPFILSDVSGGGQRLPIYLSHSGDDHLTGWDVIEAHPPDTPDDCFLRWSKKRDLFVTTCNDDTFPANGGSLNHYSWSVTEDGRLIIDLRKPLGGRVTTTTAAT
jgi:hypothetical protein